MNEVHLNDSEDTLTRPFTSFQKLLIVIGALLFALVVVHNGAKLLRSANHLELSERFIRTTDVIRTEAGDIVRISSGQGILHGSFGEWEVKRTVTGTERKLLVTVWMHCNSSQEADRYSTGCTLQRASYASESEPATEVEIPISWYDKYLIVYR